jgi:hypothetical protein
MNRTWSWLLLLSTAVPLAQQSALPNPKNDVMLAAVSRDQYMFSGGIGPGKLAGKGNVAIEPLVFLTALGEWKSLPCIAGSGKGCRKFAHDYLGKAHVYTVISADGQGATVKSSPATLSECYGFVGEGTYSGATIQKSAIAASSVDLFTDGPALKQVETRKATAIRKALAAFVPKKLDSTDDLRIFSINLETQDLLVVQRAYADLADPQNSPRRPIFIIGTMEQGRFRMLHWKQNTIDGEERVVGAIRLKSGRAFLITTVSDPESQFFRIYGIQDGHLTLIYSGGGSSC